MKFKLKQIIIFELLHKSIAILVILPLINTLFELAFSTGLNQYFDLYIFQHSLTSIKFYLVVGLIIIILLLYLMIEIIYLLKILSNPVKSFEEIAYYIRNNKRQFIKASSAYLVLYIIIFSVLNFSNFTIFSLAKNQINDSLFLQLMIFAILTLISWMALNTILKIVSQHQVKGLNKVMFYNKILVLIIVFKLCFALLTLAISLVIILNYQNFSYINIVKIKNIIDLLELLLASIIIPLVLISSLSYLLKTGERQQKSRVVLVCMVLVSMIYVINNYDTQYMAIDKKLIINSSYPLKPTALAIAHRGASLWAPGNSMASIMEAIEMESDYIELDVQVSLDGIPVLFHDNVVTKSNTNCANFKLCGNRINQLTFQQLSQLTLATPFKDVYQMSIISLKQALTTINGQSGVFLEMKTDDPADLKIINNTIFDSNFAGEIAILSFNVSTLFTMKDFNQAYQTILLITDYLGSINSYLNNPQLNGFAFEYSAINKAFVSDIHQYDKKVYVWTINDNDKISHALASGVDGIITDIPMLLKDDNLSDNIVTFSSIYNFLK